MLPDVALGRTSALRIARASHTPLFGALATELQRQLSTPDRVRVNASRQYFIVLSALLAAAESCREHGDRIVVTELPAAPGLREGAQVFFRGIEIGRVEQIALAHSGVRLALRIQRPDSPLRAGDRVALRTVGLFGDAALEIVPGPGSAPSLGDSATLAAVPPDTLAPAREAAAQAVVKAWIEPLRQRDSASAPGSRAP